MSSSPPSTEKDAQSRPSEPLKVLSSVSIMFAGALAGGISKTVVAPVDRVKILYQVNPHSEFSLLAGLRTAKNLIVKEGVSGLWKGHGAELSRVLPHSGISFVTFGKSNEWLETSTGQQGFHIKFLAGATAGATATVCTYPLDLLRARLAVQGNYTSYLEAVRDILRSEGLRGLHHGLSPTLLGMLPYAGLSFATFETLKSQLTTHYGSDQDIPQVIRLAAGGFAGVVAQTGSYPLHVIRRRMQVQALQNASNLDSQAMSGFGRYRSVFGALVSIYKTEGLQNGLFKGLALTWLKAPVMTAVAFSMNDFLRQKMMRWNEMEKELDEMLTAPATYSERRQLSAVEGVVAGGFAGALAKTVIAPGDRVKIMYQVNSNMHFSFKNAWTTAVSIVRTDGVWGLWKGNGAMMPKVFASAGISYMSFERYERIFCRVLDRDKDVTTRFFAGAAAGATATVISYPLDLLRARMAVSTGSSGGAGLTYFQLMTTISKDGFRNYFNGITPTLYGILPYAGISFATYETLKAKIRERYSLKTDKEISTGQRLSSGCVAGLIAQSATYPMDIVRRRMQVGTASGGVLRALQTIYGMEGWRGLYKGLSMNWIKGPVAVAISFTVNDLFKHMLQTIEWAEFK